MKVDRQHRMLRGVLENCTPPTLYMLFGYIIHSFYVPVMMLSASYMYYCCGQNTTVDICRKIDALEGLASLYSASVMRQAK